VQITGFHIIYENLFSECKKNAMISADIILVRTVKLTEVFPDR